MSTREKLVWGPLGFPQGPPAWAASPHCRVWGHGAPGQRPGNPDGPSGPRRDKHQVRVSEHAGYWVPALGRSCALGDLRLRTVSSYCRTLGPSQLQTGRQEGRDSHVHHTPPQAQGLSREGVLWQEDTVLPGGQAGFGHLRDPPRVSGQVPMSPARPQPGEQG